MTFLWPELAAEVALTREGGTEGITNAFLRRNTGFISSLLRLSPLRYKIASSHSFASFFADAHSWNWNFIHHTSVSVKIAYWKVSEHLKNIKWIYKSTIGKFGHQKLAPIVAFISTTWPGCQDVATRTFNPRWFLITYRVSSDQIDPAPVVDYFETSK